MIDLIPIIGVSVLGVCVIGLYFFIEKMIFRNSNYTSQQGEVKI